MKIKRHSQQTVVLFGLAASPSVAVVGRLRHTTRANQMTPSPPPPAPICPIFHCLTAIGAPVGPGTRSRKPPPPSKAKRTSLRRLLESRPAPSRRWPPGRWRRGGEGGSTQAVEMEKCVDHLLLVASSSSTFSFVVSRHAGLATTTKGPSVDCHPSFLAIALRVVTIRNPAGD